VVRGVVSGEEVSVGWERVSSCSLQGERDFGCWSRTSLRRTSGRRYICAASHLCLYPVVSDEGWGLVKGARDIRLGMCRSRCSLRVKLFPQYAQKTILRGGGRDSSLTRREPSSDVGDDGLWSFQSVDGVVVIWYRGYRASVARMRPVWCGRREGCLDGRQG
jgi:hypothetical protein